VRGQDMIEENIIDLKAYKEQKSKLKEASFEKLNSINSELQNDVDELIESLTSMIKIYEQQSRI